MKEYTDKQIELIRRVNENFELIEIEKYWIEIAKTYCEYEDNDDYLICKIGLLLDIINKHNLKIYKCAEDLLCDLRLFL